MLEAIGGGVGDRECHERKKITLGNEEFLGSPIILFDLSLFLTIALLSCVFSQERIKSLFRIS